jgi:hypothetical protein
MTMMRALIVSCLSLCLMAQTAVTDPLSQARDFYNDGAYDDAIRTAAVAQQVPQFEAAAGVILARAYLERYRQLSQAADLEAARRVMRAVDATALEPRERVELFIALGTSIYIDETSGFDHRFAAAAEQFELAFGQAELLEPDDRDQLFDWWAGSLDRQAQQGVSGDRSRIYERILERAQAELRDVPSSRAAAYWLAAGARGQGDLTRAIGAAVAGWVRAAALGPDGEALRIDLDRLLRQVILPERAQELVPDGDPHPTLAMLQTQWERFKATWEGNITGPAAELPIVIDPPIEVPGVN